MENRFGALPTIVERSVDESDAEELPVSYNCVSESVTEVVGGQPVGVRDDTDEPAARLKVLDNSLNAFFKDVWAGRNVMKREVITDNIKRSAAYTSYVAHLKNRLQPQTFGTFPRFRKSRDIWIETDKSTLGPLLQVATPATPTVQNEVARIDALLNKLPLE